MAIFAQNEKLPNFTKNKYWKSLFSFFQVEQGEERTMTSMVNKGYTTTTQSIYKSTCSHLHSVEIDILFCHSYFTWNSFCFHVNSECWEKVLLPHCGITSKIDRVANKKRWHLLSGLLGPFKFLPGIEYHILDIFRIKINRRIKIAHKKPNEVNQKSSGSIILAHSVEISVFF